MKKLITLSYTILCLVLLILCYMNFSHDVIENIENGKQKIVITKDKNQTNSEFLQTLEKAMSEQKLDIMYRYMETDGDDLKYYFYRTYKTNTFIDKESANILPCITFYDLEEAGRYDLATGIFYADKSQCDKTVNAIQDMGYTVTLDNSLEISGKMSIPVFTAIPIVLVVMSMIFYTLSIGKKTMLRKMEGYTTLDILKDEINKLLPMYAVITILSESVTIASVLYNYNNALIAFFKYQAYYLLLGTATVLAGMVLSCIVIHKQNKAAYIKGKVPKKGMYVLSMAVMIIFIIFIDFFMTIAIRNVKSYYQTSKTAHFMAEKVNGYVTVPIYENNASSDGLEDNYMQFYKNTVNDFKGVLIDSGNYKYDITTGKTMCEEYGEDFITINENYLKINPAYDSTGKEISLSDIAKENIIDVLIPFSKPGEKEKYSDLIENGYNAKANFIEYDSKKTKIYSYNAAAGDGAYGQIDSPVIIVINEQSLTGDYVLSYCSTDSYFLKTATDKPYEELKPILKETGIIAVTPQTPYISANYTSELAHQKSMLKLYGSQTLFLSVGIIFLIVFSSMLYCENYRKAIANKLIEGYSIGECIKTHLIFKMIIYLISLLGIYAAESITLIGFNYYIIPVMLIADISVTIVLCAKITKTNLYQIVKGEE